MLVYKSAPPLCAAHRLFCREGRAVGGGIPVVEFVDGKALPGPEEHTVRVCAQRGIAEADETSGIFCFARQTPAIGQLCPRRP
mgnify:FL=1